MCRCVLQCVNGLLKITRIYLMAKNTKKVNENMFSQNFLVFRLILSLFCLVNPKYVSVDLTPSIKIFIKGKTLQRQ